MARFTWGRFSQLAEVLGLNETGVVVDRRRNAEFGTLDLGADAGQGTLEYLHTPDMRVVVSHCTFGTGRRYEIADDGFIRFHFGSELSVQTWLRDDPFGDIADSPAGVLIARPDQVMQECIAAQKRQSFISIAVRPEWLPAQFGVQLPDQLRWEEAAHTPGAHHHPLRYGPELRQTASELIARRLPWELRSAFVAIKAQEMLILALGDLVSAPQQRPGRMSERDRAAIRSAREILTRSIAAAPDIPRLSRRVGINRTKLFYGFKQMYGMSVTAFMHGQRMDEAHRLLVDTDMSISSIATAVGYRHACNFSTRFKAHFDCSPGDCRARGRGQSGQS